MKYIESGVYYEDEVGVYARSKCFLGTNPTFEFVISNICKRDSVRELLILLGKWEYAPVKCIMPSSLNEFIKEFTCSAA